MIVDDAQKEASDMLNVSILLNSLFLLFNVGYILWIYKKNKDNNDNSFFYKGAALFLISFTILLFCQSTNSTLDFGLNSSQNYLRLFSHNNFEAHKYVYLALTVVFTGLYFALNNPTSRAWFTKK